jgi:hypothetical protein
MPFDSPAPIQTSLDHLVIAAPTLHVGVDWIERLFGVRMNPGGKHPRMGTHNALLKIGDRQYLEVIAIDPDQPAPNRERWFGLDYIDSLAQPAFITWVARTSSIQSAVHMLPWNPSSIETMNRGTLEWSLSIPKHNDWKAQSHFPLLIQWGDDQHPTDHLPDASVRLIGLRIEDPSPEQIRNRFRQMTFEDSVWQLEVHAGPPQLKAEFETPRGHVLLVGRPA